MNHRASDLQEFNKDSQNNSAAEAGGLRTMSAETSAIQPEEVVRRINEYRRIGFEKRAPAVAVYKTPYVFCPWPGCGCKIAGIDFQLDKVADSRLAEQLRTAWWQGPGLVGRCPKCRQDVLYGMTDKKVLSDLAAFESARLPEDWARIAHIVPQPAL